MGQGEDWGISLKMGNSAIWNEKRAGIPVISRVSRQKFSGI
jgi:hypothetical protein